MRRVVVSRSLFQPALLWLLALAISSSCFAHAILIDSTPSLNQVMREDHVDISLHFNSRVDGKRSQLTLISADGSKHIPLAEQKEADRLHAEAKGLKAGSYRLIWQVLASDGHLTRGQIPFKLEAGVSR